MSYSRVADGGIPVVLHVEEWQQWGILVEIMAVRNSSGVDWGSQELQWD